MRDAFNYEPLGGFFNGRKTEKSKYENEKILPKNFHSH